MRGIRKVDLPARELDHYRRSGDPLPRCAFSKGDADEGAKEATRAGRCPRGLPSSVSRAAQRGHGWPVVLGGCTSNPLIKRASIA